MEYKSNLVIGRGVALTKKYNPQRKGQQLTLVGNTQFIYQFSIRAGNQVVQALPEFYVVKRLCQGRVLLQQQTCEICGNYLVPMALGLFIFIFLNIDLTGILKYFSDLNSTFIHTYRIWIWPKLRAYDNVIIQVDLVLSLVLFQSGVSIRDVKSKLIHNIGQHRGLTNLEIVHNSKINDCDSVK